MLDPEVVEAKRQFHLSKRRGEWCIYCGVPWPCTTVALIADWERRGEALKKVEHQLLRARHLVNAYGVRPVGFATWDEMIDAGYEPNPATLGERANRFVRAEAEVKRLEGEKESRSAVPPDSVAAHPRAGGTLMDPEVGQSPPEKWSVCERKYGHVYSGGRTGPLRDGYATCRLCGAHENEKAIIQPCPENPLLADWERRGEALRMLRVEIPKRIWTEKRDEAADHLVSLLDAAVAGWSPKP